MKNNKSAMQVSEDYLNNGECTVCSSNYHQEIITILKRYHSSSEESLKVIETRFCPSCGRFIIKEE